MREYWPAELGRDDPITFGSTTIWATNRLKLTGGFLGAEVVPHTENFYALSERPDAIAFCCERAPWLGGQTALFDGISAVAELPERLRLHHKRPKCAAFFLSTVCG